MITEDYVSFETAKLLNEKGFDEPCFAYYSEYWDNWKSFRFWKKFPKRNVPNKGYLNVPTLALVMKWLREVYKIHIAICLGGDIDNPNHIFYNPQITIFEQYKSIAYLGEFGEDEFDTYELAAETAIKYCLENLI